MCVQRVFQPDNAPQPWEQTPPCCKSNHSHITSDFLWTFAVNGWNDNFLETLSLRSALTLPVVLPSSQRRADAEGCPVLHAVLPRQGAYQRCAAVWGADGGARLQYTSYHASIPTIHSVGLRARSNLQAWKICFFVRGRAESRPERHCQLSRSSCYGCVWSRNCQGSKKGNMWE